MIQRFLNYFVPDTHKGDEWAYRKLKLFVSVSFVSALYAIFYFPTSVMEEYWGAVKVIVFFTVCNLSFPFLLKNKVPLNLLVNAYILVLAISLSRIMYISGGVFHTSTDPQLMVLAPVMALLFLNYRAAIIWFFIAMSVLVVFGTLQLYGYNFDISMNYKYIQLQNLLAVCGHLLLVFMVINIFENQKNKALKKLSENNVIIEAEKKRSDNLLLNILPFEIAEELKRDGKATARYFENVTVIFTDFVNFTRISEEMSPTELVSEIHKHFTVFDNIIEKHGLEKIKTIGDAYLAVCGLPNEIGNHAERVVNAAIDINGYISNSNSKFKVRIGIHSGSVVAGIVGSKKYAYDIWGDTVNLASRVESSSEEGKINISGSTYSLVNDKFTCIYRGKIHAKHKGEVDMYFVER